jgi:hypothetical protein
MFSLFSSNICLKKNILGQLNTVAKNLTVSLKDLNILSLFLNVYYLLENTGKLLKAA